MGNLSVIFFSFLRGKLHLKLKSNLIKSNHKVLRKNDVDTFEAPVFAPNYSATVLAAKMCTNFNEHFMYIKSLWSELNPII
jgi:hypothetical protein